MKLKHFFAMMLTLVCVVFGVGCIGQPDGTDSDESTDPVEDSSVDEPSANATFFPPKCAPDSCGFICYTSATKRFCRCLDADCE